LGAKPYRERTLQKSGSTSVAQYVYAPLAQIMHSMLAKPISKKAVIKYEDSCCESTEARELYAENVFWHKKRSMTV
jgi:hypothetical protein